MKKTNYYLITGGIGLIGSNIVKKIFYKDKNSICVLLDNFTVYIDPLKAAFGDFRKGFRRDNFFLTSFRHHEWIPDPKLHRI